MTELFYDRIETEIGTILVVSDGTALCALDFAEYEDRMRGLLGRRFEDVQLVARDNPNGFSESVRAYFDGQTGAFDDVPLNLGGTGFQRTVWAALKRIPVGETASYGALAAAIGRPGAARAVGLANSLNPVAIAVPCHRVIGGNGSLTGYAGGLERKKWLLEHEAART